MSTPKPGAIDDTGSVPPPRQEDPTASLIDDGGGASQAEQKKKKEAEYGVPCCDVCRGVCRVCSTFFCNCRGMMLLLLYFCDKAVFVYAVYVGNKFRGDPAPLCHSGAIWFLVEGSAVLALQILLPAISLLFSLFLAESLPFLLECIGGLFCIISTFLLGWGIYGVMLFFDAGAQKCNGELYHFGYTVSIIMIVSWALVCVGLCMLCFGFGAGFREIINSANA